MGLALALNALHPQDVPGDSRAEWDEFNRAVVTGERLFLQPVWQSTAGLEWLKVCIRLSRRADKEALANWLPKWNDIDQIVRFRAALTQIVQQQVSPNRSNPASDADTTVANAVDRAVLNIADQGLLDAARLFFEELGRAQKKERARQTLSREILMPLMPEDFISDDGATRVTALCTNHQLLQHGKKMCNCLRYTSVASFARKGKAGTVFIVGLYDMLSGKALSTAEIRAYPGRDDAPYQLGIRQHTGKANARPSSRCARVLREFLRHCLTEEIRQHVLSNWTVLRGRSKPDAKEPPRLPVALRSTLGEQLYEGLVTSIRGTNNYRHGDMHGG